MSNLRESSRDVTEKARLRNNPSPVLKANHGHAHLSGRKAGPSYNGYYPLDRRAVPCYEWDNGSSPQGDPDSMTRRFVAYCGREQLKSHPQWCGSFEAADFRAFPNRVALLLAPWEPAFAG